MKLSEAIEIKQGKFEIPDCSRSDLPELWKHLGYRVGAEIGVYKGKFTKHLCRSGFQISAIDPYCVDEDFNEVSKQYPWKARKYLSQQDLDAIYEGAVWRLSGFSNCRVIRKTSMEAVKDFQNGSLDFVYIDGNHFIKYVAEDIWEWYKKLRSGGMISGHDYLDREDCPCQVKSVVDLYIKIFGIRNWYVLGSELPRAGEHRDVARSWMWFKP